MFDMQNLHALQEAVGLGHPYLDLEEQKFCKEEPDHTDWVYVPDFIKLYCFEGTCH